MSETGVQSMPSIDAWQQITNSTGDWNFFSELVQHREHGAEQNQLMYVFKKIVSFYRL